MPAPAASTVSAAISCIMLLLLLLLDCSISKPEVCVQLLVVMNNSSNGHL
jgi:hypothetical protein